jgi:hypothetical protein
MSDALLGVVIGGAIGLLGSFLGPNLAAHLSSRRERQKAQALVRAYLIGILEISEARDHVRRAQAVLASWGSGNDITFEFYAGDSLKNDLVESGELAKQTSYLNEDDAADLARFISKLQAVRVDMALMSTPQFKSRPIESRIATVSWAVDQWLAAVEMAKKLIARL